MQVIDARDPLTYRSDDLEQYARDIAPHKGSLLLLNKADLLSAELRTAWADYFDEQGVSYVFWSAKAAADALKQDAGAPRSYLQEHADCCCARRACLLACPLRIGYRHEGASFLSSFCRIGGSCPGAFTSQNTGFAGRSQPQKPGPPDPRARVLTSDELLAVFQQKAQEAVDKATPEYLQLRVIVMLILAYVPPSHCCAPTT